MQIYFKTRNAARSVKSGKMQDNWQGLPEHLKGGNNGLQSISRWGRVIDIQKKEKQQISLKCVKDWRNIENAKSVELVKIKKNKLI